MELPMSALTYTNTATTGYFTNIANAARQLIAAVFAVQPAVAQCNKEDTASELRQMAKDCESHSPSLAAELRVIAFRG